jgi:hypothetical protein
MTMGTMAKVAAAAGAVGRIDDSICHKNLDKSLGGDTAARRG